MAAGWTRAARVFSLHDAARNALYKKQSAQRSAFFAQPPSARRANGLWRCHFIVVCCEIYKRDFTFPHAISKLLRRRHYVHHELGCDV
jgi:hypothetical protein